MKLKIHTVYSGTHEQVRLRVMGDPWECLHMKQFLSQTTDHIAKV